MSSLAIGLLLEIPASHPRSMVFTVFAPKNYAVEGSWSQVLSLDLQETSE